MNNYIQGYLSSIPQSEKDNILNFIKAHISTKFNIPASEANLYLERLLSQSQITDNLDLPKKEDSPLQSYNNLYSKIDIDLNYLFKVINSFYSVVESYKLLSESYIESVQVDLDKISSSIDNFKEKIISNEDIIITESFTNNSVAEQINEQNAYLFLDRDGSSTYTTLNRNNHKGSHISLSYIKTDDLLHDEYGKAKAIINILDFKGMPVESNNSINKAVDNNIDSYWDCSTILDERITSNYMNYDIPGAYMKFRILLSKTYDISEITINPFCIHPMDICSITLDGREIINNPIRIDKPTDVYEGSSNADEIVFTIRQRHYTNEIISKNDKKEEIKDIQNKIISSYASEEDISNYFTDKHTDEINKQAKLEIIRRRTST